MVHMWMCIEIIYIYIYIHIYIYIYIYTYTHTCMYIYIYTYTYTYTYTHIVIMITVLVNITIMISLSTRRACEMLRTFISTLGSPKGLMILIVCTTISLSFQLSICSSIRCKCSGISTIRFKCSGFQGKCEVYLTPGMFMSTLDSTSR